MVIPKIIMMVKIGKSKMENRQKSKTPKHSPQQQKIYVTFLHIVFHLQQSHNNNWSFLYKNKKHPDATHFFNALSVYFLGRTVLT